MGNKTTGYRGLRISARVALAALVVGAAAASPAEASFGAPFNLSDSGRDAFSPQVAADANGDAVFVWTRDDNAGFRRIQARARSAGGVLGAVKVLSAAGAIASGPQVAVDADGDSVFTWFRFDGTTDRVQTRARSAGGALSAVQNLSAAGQESAAPHVAVDADGDAVFAWQGWDGANFRFKVRARSAAGALSPVQALSASGQDANGSEVAVDANGDAVFTWSRFDGADYRIQARARSAAGVLSPVQNLSAAGQDAVSPQVGVDANGDAVFTWIRSDGSNDRIEARGRSAAGALSAVDLVSDAGKDASSPRVAVDPDGPAVFTWVRVDAAANSRIQARRRSAGGVLSAVQTLSGSGQDAAVPQVDVDADGDAVIAWQGFDGANFRAQARTRSFTGALGGVQILSAAGQSAFNPQVGVAADGDAVATWARFDSVNTRIQGSAGP